MKLYKGDCVDVMKSFNADSIDLTVTSPPYDNLRTYNGNNALWGEHVWKAVIEQLYRVTKTGGVVVWVVGDATVKGSETGTSFKQALYFKEVGFNLHDTMIYKRFSAYPGNVRYWDDFEYMFIFSIGKPKTINLIQDVEKKYIKKTITETSFTYRNKKTGRTDNISDIVIQRKLNANKKKYRVRENIWDIKSGYGLSTQDKEAYQHPAIFPEQLANDHIISWSNENDIVLDPFMGSGTTGKMALKNNRNFIGIELDDKYFKIATERING